MALFESPKWVIYEGVVRLKYGEKKRFTPLNRDAVLGPNSRWKISFKGSPKIGNK